MKSDISERPLLLHGDPKTGSNISATDMTAGFWNNHARMVDISADFLPVQSLLATPD